MEQERTEERGQDRRKETTGRDDAPQEKVQQAREQVERNAGQLKDAVAERAEENADAQMDWIAREGRTLVKALQRATQEAEQDGSALAGPFRQAAQACDKMSRNAHGKDTSQALSDLETFGRRQPAAFFGAAMAAGFFSTRFLRAGANQRASSSEARRSAPASREPHAGASESRRQVASAPDDRQTRRASGFGNR